MSGNEVDEAARSWAQLVQLVMQLMQHYRAHTRDGSIRLTRRQHQQLLTEAREVQRMFAYQTTITQQWYQARLEDYQRESATAATRAEEGATAAERAQVRAYLSGLRAGIEHTVHDTPLSVEQRGQIVQVLDQIEAEPEKPVARNVFQPVNATTAVRARYAAAESEQRVMRHHQQLVATETVDERAQPKQTVSNAELIQLRRDNADLYNDVARRIQRLEQRIEQLQIRETATAAAESNGHAPRTAQQDATATATAEQQAEQHADHMYAEAEPVSAEHAEAEQSDTTPPQTVYTAQMEAEA
ncbi:hypothetical protein [Nocardia arthritidis]|uniref:Uncharacterized protein n=1 Tax=Nocardia arthritidis TaxID=228602 RepID=A0A6G9YC00_9NOCA|nr:hypothetical protein [Nocardia arthritidis]QIS10751.1 hypothetical protein F5544_14320 [Nocardia arthritidis]